MTTALNKNLNSGHHFIFSLILTNHKMILKHPQNGNLKCIERVQAQRGPGLRGRGRGKGASDGRGREGRGIRRGRGWG